MSSTSAPEPARRPWSLAARLTAWYAGTSFLLVVLTTGFLYWFLETNLEREDDQLLADKLRILRSLVRERPDDSPSLRQEVGLQSAEGRYGPFAMRVLDRAGRVLAETPGMAATLPPELFPTPADDVDRPAGREVQVNGRTYRVVAARAPSPVGRVLQVGQDRTQEEEILADYRRGVWAVLGVALVACALGGYEVARRGLRPIAAITETARHIRPATLGQRIAAGGLPAELAGLADRLNDMLARLEEAFGRLTRFSADIAHELRTPVQGLRAGLEVALGQKRSPAEYHEVLGSSLEECVRLASIIDNLLFLARAEGPQAAVKREPVDVARELAAVCELYEAAAAEAGVSLQIAAPAGLTAPLDRTLLQRAVGNLVANALAHTPRGGRVDVTATTDAGRVRVEVADTGAGIAAEHLPHIFDRFYRADDSRSAASGGVGLGLAIVKGIATLHGGAVSIASEPGRGTRVTLHLPSE